jgi:hypothetical protein
MTSLFQLPVMTRQSNAISTQDRPKEMRHP